MKLPDRVTVIFFFIVILGILAAGCTSQPATADQPVVTITTVKVTHPPAVTRTATVQETAITPPEAPSRHPIDGIGNDGLWALYTVSATSKTGIRIDTYGKYRFAVTKYDGRSLKLYLTDWAGDTTVELYDSTKRSPELRENDRYPVSVKRIDDRRRAGPW